MSTQPQQNTYKHELDVALHQMLKTHEAVIADQIDGDGVSVESQYNFEQSVMVMRQRLLPFVDPNGPTGEIWKQNGLDLIPKLCARQVGVTESTTGHFGMPSPGGEPIVRHAPVEKLELWTDAMVQIYDELGFTPETKDRQIEARGEYSDILD